MTPAGYSGTPLARKLGIRAGGRVLLVGAPPGFEDTLAGLPPDAFVTRRVRAGARYDVIVLFAERRARLAAALSGLVRALVEDGGLWLAWPKKASGVATDLGDNEVRALGLGAGLVDNKVCAVDETWSGLRFVRRIADRR